MKKIITVAFLLLVYVSIAHAQNCKYKTNEIDKFTKKYTKLTKAERVISTFNTTGLFSVKKVDTSYYFIFDYVLSGYTNFDPYSVKKGAELIFLLENGETIILKSADDILGTKNFIVGIPPVYTCTLSNVAYPVSKNQIDKFFVSQVSSIRFFRTESNGKEDYIDSEIKEKNMDDIQDLIKCIL